VTLLRAAVQAGQGYFETIDGEKPENALPSSSWTINVCFTPGDPRPACRRRKVGDRQQGADDAHHVLGVGRIGALIDAADSLKFKAAFALLALGTRREEVLGFKWSDISPAWDKIHVQRAVTLAKGPARHSEWPVKRGQVEGRRPALATPRTRRDNP
jgi:hypothetical protein